MIGGQRLALFTPCRSPGERIVNLADPERLFPAPLGLSGQHNRRAKEFPDPSRRATDTTSIPRPLKLTMRGTHFQHGNRGAISPADQFYLMAALPTGENEGIIPPVTAEFRGLWRIALLAMAKNSAYPGF